MLADILMWMEDNLLLTAAGAVVLFGVVMAAVVMRRRANAPIVTRSDFGGVADDMGDLQQAAAQMQTRTVQRPATAAGYATVDQPGTVFSDTVATDNLSAMASDGAGAGSSETGADSSGFDAMAGRPGATAGGPAEPQFNPLMNPADARMLLHMIQGDPPRRKFSALYVVCMALVAGAMLLLPVIYMAFVASVGYGVYVFATTTRASIMGMGMPMIFRIFLYITPIIVGGVSVLFLLKPFFARSQKSMAPLELKEKDQPLLFAFIRELCLTLKAPMPKRVIVWCDANASASLRHGIWSIFMPGDVQLHIGLKLVEGMDLQSFAGVLAHEFGHFTQGTAMRLNAVIGTMNHWLARLVYEEDNWDAALDALAEESPSLFPIVFLLAKLAVKIGRGVLWILLQIAHALSCMLMRQQEYDADRYESYIAGSRTFRKTTERIVSLSIVGNMSNDLLNEGLKRMVLPENYVDVFGRVLKSMPQDFFEEIPAVIESEKKGWFRTHPTGPQRIAHAEQLQMQGIFHPPEAPASVLFRNLDKVCEDATMHLYRTALGRLVDKRITTPTDNFLERLNVKIRKRQSPEMAEVG